MPSHHSQLNPDKVFERPATPRSERDQLITAKADKISTSDLANELIALYKEMDEETKTLIKTSLATHLDGDFTHKNALKRALVKCVDVLSSEEELKQRGISADRKELLLDKLREGIQNCTPGFFNRVNSVLLALAPPTSIEQLLAGFRSRLVEDAFNEDEIRASTKREVHTNNNFYQTANGMGYGVPYTEDPYHGMKSEAVIQAALEKTFLKKFTPSQIVHHLLDGAMEDVSSEHQHQNLEFIKMVLKNDVINLGDVFKYDEDGIYQGVNWVNIHSLLYQVLEKEGFIFAVPKENLIEKEIAFQVVLKKTVYKEGVLKEEDFADKQVIKLSIDKNNKSEAMLTYHFTDSDTDQNKKLYGYLSAEPSQHILSMLPAEYAQTTAKIIYKSLQENQALTLESGIRLFSLSKIQETDEISKNIALLINTTEDVATAFKLLTPNESKMMFDAIKIKLPGMIKRAEDFENVLRHIAPEQGQIMFEAIKVKLLGMIRTVEDLAAVLKHLSPHQCVAICATVRHWSDSIIPTPYSITILLGGLTPEQCTAVCEEIKTNLKNIIKSGDDFASVLYSLAPEQRTVVYEAMKTKLPEMIKSGGDFAAVHSFLTPEQSTAVCETMKTKLPEIIKSGSDFKIVYAFLTPEQCIAVFGAMKTKLPDIINSAGDFASVFPYITAEQRAEIFPTLCGTPKDLFRFISDGHDMTVVLQTLSGTGMLDYSPQRLDNFKAEYIAIHETRFTFSVFGSEPYYLDKLNGLSDVKAWEKIVEDACKNTDRFLSKALVKAIFVSASQSLEQRNAPQR